MGYSMGDAMLEIINFLWFAQTQLYEVCILLKLSPLKKAMLIKSLKLVLECCDTDIDMEWRLFI